MTCPYCQRDAIAQQVGFTWWGGFIGAKFLNHVECTACHGRYNGKTGRPNTTAIALYTIVLGLLGLGLVWMILQ